MESAGNIGVFLAEKGLDPKTREACARIAEEVGRRRHLAGDGIGSLAAQQIADFIRGEAFSEIWRMQSTEASIPIDEALFTAFQAAREGRASQLQKEVLRRQAWTIFDRRTGQPEDVTFEKIEDMQAWDSVVNAPWFFRTPEELRDEASLVLQLERIAPHRLRRKPGPPKGKPLKIKVGGDWTPQLLRSELTRLGLSETKFARLMGVNQKSVNKWCTKGIPDARQAQISDVLNALEPPVH